jgi:hypothetical protein
VALARLVVGIGGAALVGFVVVQAIRTFVVPRPARLRLNWIVFIAMRRVFDAGVRLSDATDNRRRRDGIMAHWAPLSLLTLPGVWLVLAMIGYAAIFWAVLDQGVRSALEISGSSLLTLGFANPGTFQTDLIAFSEAVVGVALLALVITYLPTIYSAYSRREVEVALLDTRAGSPPSPIQLLLRHHQYGGLDRLDTKWNEWERWVVDLGQSHLTHASLPFFRSASPDDSWLTAVAALLDAANLRLSAIALPTAGNADAAMYLRAATRVVREIADLFKIPVDHAGDLRLSAAELDSSLDELEAAGVPLDPDRSAIAARFMDRRALYEPSVLGLASLLQAAPTQWSSDRSPPFQLPPIFRRTRR